MTGIQITGLASGLDTESIISQLMSIESQPRTRMARQQVAVQARQDALRQIDTKLTNLKLAATDLRSAVLWTPVQTSSSSSESVLTARMTGAAAPGAATVEVQNLASAEQHTIAAPTSGRVTISSGGSYDYTSLDDLVGKINGDDQGSVYAVNVNGNLVLSRRVTGADQGFTADFGVSASETVKAGKDAQYTVDGVAQSSPTNVVTNGLPGIELTLKTVGTSTVNVSNPAADPTQVSNKLKAFVSAYNDAVTLVRGELTEKRVSNPQSDDDAKQGVLFGDTALNGLLGQLRQTISEAGLDQLGVKVSDSGSATDADALAGKLTFDQAAFDAAWASGPQAVQQKLTAFAPSFEAVLDPVTRAGDGLMDQRVKDADSEISSIKDQLARMDERLQNKEDYLRAQFTALETALSKSQSQASDLASQLAQLQS
ncbi:MAG TPA: flagellar filament capping protein FliD [Solirubrobacteraceae bacterium]|nr:flagellar filament capping protein FliD [Solirubrobacteraceae bacterium]